MEALVWVDGYQVQDGGFVVGQQVTWPISRQINLAALTELVGPDTAAETSMGVDFHTGRSSDTVDHSGLVARIVAYRCRHDRGRVVPGSVVSDPVPRAVFAGLDDAVAIEDGVHFVGYLVTVSDLHRISDER